MSNRLFKVLEGIVDTSNDYTEETLASVSEVVAYAEAGGETITDAEAMKIIKVGKNWLDDQENGNGEWSRMRHEAMAALA